VQCTGCDSTLDCHRHLDSVHARATNPVPRRNTGAIVADCGSTQTSSSRRVYAHPTDAISPAPRLSRALFAQTDKPHHTLIDRLMLGVTTRANQLPATAESPVAESPVAESPVAGRVAGNGRVIGNGRVAVSFVRAACELRNGTN